MKKSDYGNLDITLPTLLKKPFWFQLLHNNYEIIGEFYGKKTSTCLAIRSKVRII
ncbi:MAG: hypothetical protein ABI045_00410 [Flavobacteriales bacterium]